MMMNLILGEDAKQADVRTSTLNFEDVGDNIVKSNQAKGL